MIEIRAVDHIGIRVADLDRAVAFYEVLGFELLHKDPHDAVAILKNKEGVEINLVYNANNDHGGKNVLMDVPDKYAGFTHIAFNVEPVETVISALGENGIKITQGPVTFGLDGHVSVFVRDPDLNVIEFRGRSGDLSTLENVVVYKPKN
jgi:lactoylglutathione lyase